MSDRQDIIRQVLEESPESTVALNPLTGLHWEDLRDVPGKTAFQGIRQPLILGQHLAGHGRKLLNILVRDADYAPDKRDRRFQDESWQQSGIYQRLLQSYLAFNESLDEWVDDLDLSDLDRLRADFLLRLVCDSIAPTNTLLGNPAALRKAVDTRGKSLVKGLRNLVHDIRHNHGIPSQVKSDNFHVGENLATSPGAVVFSNEVLELIQYAPSTDQVHRRPLLMVSAMINKFYSLDLTPDRSMVKYCVDNQIQLFMVSWANPGVEHAVAQAARYYLEQRGQGNEPPEFDLLYWNNDWTNLPAQLHADVIDMFSTGCLLEPGGMSIQGVPLDLSVVDCDKFVIGGLSDHITPWKACYRTGQAYTGKVEFLLSNSGHIQTLLNSPSKKRCSYFVNRELPERPDDWLDGAELEQGSWWDYWRRWLVARSGSLKPAPAALGNKKYPAGVAAPGAYVLQQSE